MSISSQQVAGSAGATTGDVRTAESYPSDQYAKVEVTSTQLTGGQWVGPAVRVQGGGQNGYLGIYFWNSGNPVLRLYQEERGQLYAAWQRLRLRGAGGGDAAGGHGGR